MTFPNKKCTRFDAQSLYCRFIGYSEQEKAYRFEDIKSRRVLVSRDAKFMEDVIDGGRRTQGEAEDVMGIKEDKSKVMTFLPY